MTRSEQTSSVASAAEQTKVGHTPGPWDWFGNARNNEVYLATTHSGRRYVMGFRRWGMRGAQPMFQPGNRGLVAAEKLLTFEVGDRSVRGVEAAKADDSVYRLDISGIDCADARLIAAAPDGLELAEDAIPILEAVLEDREMVNGEECEILRDLLARTIEFVAKARGEQP